MLKKLCLCVVLAAAPMFARSGLCKSDPIADETHHEFQFFAGYSPASSTLIGTTTDRRFVAAGFDYSYRCWAWQNVTVSFTAGLMPAAILLQPTESFVVSDSRIGLEFGTVPSHAVYGFAATPVGMTIDFARSRTVFPFFQTDEGFIVSTQPIPENVPDASSFNFLFDLGGGVKWHPARKRYAITFGYKFLHISNAYRTSVNPGVDNNLIYAGYSFLR